jgi:hypothetical protein
MLRIVTRLSWTARTRGVEIPAHEHEAGAVHGDVGARAHGDADIGGGEGRGVVEAVAGEDHAFAAGAVFADQLLFAGGSDAGMVAVEVERLGELGGDLLAVARDHHDAEAELPEIEKGDGRHGLGGVGEADGADFPAVDHDMDHGEELRIAGG